ncbi:hypothetical protein BHE74_00019923 [Ensete ventricosum]|nr:hypothetical protein BHE74_00019923 [Ensete ventricosum]
MGEEGWGGCRHNEGRIGLLESLHRDNGEETRVGLERQGATGEGRSRVAGSNWGKEKVGVDGCLEGWQLGNEEGRWRGLFEVETEGRSGEDSNTHEGSGKQQKWTRRRSDQRLDKLNLA